MTSDLGQIHANLYEKTRLDMRESSLDTELISPPVYRGGGKGGFEGGGGKEKKKKTSPFPPRSQEGKMETSKAREMWKDIFFEIKLKI